MNISNVSTQVSNALTPFEASPNSELTNPVNASPMPPIKAAEHAERAGDRDHQQASSHDADSENEDVSSEDPTSEQSSNDVKASANGQLSEQELSTLMQLKARDSEVRAHEQAHVAVGGKYAGAASYEYERGPDGGNYAVAGEVPISLPSGGGDPEQNIQQAEQVIRAALAPAEPSSQDRAVAAKAAQLKTEAQTALREQKQLQANGEDESNRDRGSRSENSAQNTDQTQSKQARSIQVYQAYSPQSVTVGSTIHNQA